MKKLGDKEIQRTIRIIEKHVTMTAAARELKITTQNLYKRLENNGLKVTRDVKLKVVNAN
jgi:DNA-binding phage protein